MNSMGWSRRDPDIPVNTASTPILSRLQALNPFGSEGYVRLPTSTHEGPGAPLPAPSRREEEEGFFARKSARAPRRLMFAREKVTKSLPGHCYHTHLASSCLHIFLKVHPTVHLV